LPKTSKRLKTIESIDMSSPGARLAREELIQLINTLICDSTIFSKQTSHFSKLKKTQEIVYKKCIRNSLAVFLFIVFYYSVLV
jgi:hypothetical protein